MAEITTPEQFDTLKAQLKAGAYSDRPALELELAQAASAWKASHQAPRYGSLAEEAIGLGETALQMGTGAAANIPAGFSGLLAGAIPGGRTAESARANIQDKLTYRPRTEVGQRTSEGLANLVAPALEFADRTAEDAGEPTDVIGATLARTAMEFGLGAAGLKALKSSKTLKPIKRTSRPEPAPTTQQLARESAAAYRAAEQSGAVIPKADFGKFVDDLKVTLADEGIDTTLHPGATAALRRLMADSDKNISLKGAEIYRKIINDAGKGPNAADGRMAGIMRDSLDEFMGGIDGSEALVTARNLWQRKSKGESIQNLIDRAKLTAPNFTGSGMENALRTEFRALAKNQRRMRLFSSEEQAAIRRVAEGGTAANMLRFVGKFAPRGVVSTTLSGGAGFALGGPVGSAAMLGIGEAGRLGATILTKRNALAASELVRRGPNALPLQWRNLSEALSTRRRLPGPRR